ncbi:MAG: STAS domain-containing protein [Firmicutes bacterium]|nr:STAS domain-containing protein [Bacillota bacterium]
MADLSIQVREADDLAVLAPDGFINAHTVRQFESALEDLVKAGKFTILLDCERLNYISSAGLGAIMGLIETVRENRGDILLCSLQENVFAIFDTLGFTQLYRVFANETEARKALAESAE